MKVLTWNSLNHKFKAFSFGFLFLCLFSFARAQYDSLSRIHHKTYEEISKNYRRGLINKLTGDTLLQPLYTQIEAFSEGLARVHGNNFVGYIDTTGKFVIPLGIYKSPRGGSEVGLFSCGLAAVVKDNLYGAIDKNGQVIIPFESRKLYNFSDSAALTIENDKIGLINTKNETLLKREYDRLWKYKSILYLTKDDKMAFADLKGQLKCDFEFDDVKPNRYGGVVLTKNGKQGYADKDGIQLVPCVYDRILWYDSENKTTWVRNSDVLSILDSNFKVLAEVPNGEEINATTPGNPIGIFLGNSIQYFSVDGKAVSSEYQYLTQKHSSAYRFKNGKCIVAQNGKWGLINQVGKELIPFEYDWLMPPSPLNYLIGKKGNLNGMVDTNNAIVLNFRERNINYLQYAHISKLEEVIVAEKRFDSLKESIKVDWQKAVKIAKRKKMFYESEVADADVCELKEENDKLFWEISTYKSGYTKEGNCAKTNGCTIQYRKIIKIDAVSGKVMDKKSTKKLYPNYE